MRLHYGSCGAVPERLRFNHAEKAITVDRAALGQRDLPAVVHVKASADQVTAWRRRAVSP